MPTDDQIRKAIAKEMKRKKTSGTDTFARLDAIASLLDGKPLSALSTEPEVTCRALSECFKSPFALGLHIRAAICVIERLTNVPAEVRSLWQDAKDKAEIDAEAVKAEIQKNFPPWAASYEVAAAETREGGATLKTFQGYVSDLQQMLGKLNVRNLETVVLNPEEFAVKLRCACTSEGTLKNHISSILCIYKYSPRMKETYPRAFDRWSKESGIQRSRQIKESRLNAPSNSRQAQNFVPMAEWRVALDLLAKGEDPHSSLKKSQAFLLLSYACAFPPKRADLGSVRIFRAFQGSEPSEEERNEQPNHIVLVEGEARMTIGQHKTTKHYAAIEEVLPDDFLRVLKDSLDRHPRLFLFVDSKGNAFTPQCFSKWFIRNTKELFGDKAPGVSLLRHAFCTDLDLNSMTGLQLDNVAAKMGHSAARQMEYRFVESKPIHQYSRGRKSMIDRKD